MKQIPAIAKIDIPLDGATIKKGTDLTLTTGKEFKYALWHNTGIYDLPEDYVLLKSEIKENIISRIIKSIKNKFK